MKQKKNDEKNSDRNERWKIFRNVNQTEDQRPAGQHKLKMMDNRWAESIEQSTRNGMWSYEFTIQLRLN